MRGFFQSLDLYKVIILLSVVLMPVVGGWAYVLQGELELGRSALQNATRRGGDLEELGKYQKAVEELRRGSVRQSSADNPNVYFDSCIRTSDSGGELRRTDFSITKLAEKRVRNKAVDTLYSVDFKRDGKRLPLSRKFLLAVLFNCEAQSHVWKLRELSIKNENMSASGARNKAPPPELDDLWSIQRLVFASRRPLPRGE